MTGKRAAIIERLSLAFSERLLIDWMHPFPTTVLMGSLGMLERRKSVRCLNFTFADWLTAKKPVIVPTTGGKARHDDGGPFQCRSDANRRQKVWEEARIWSIKGWFSTTTFISKLALQEGTRGSLQANSSCNHIISPLNQILNLLLLILLKMGACGVDAGILLPGNSPVTIPGSRNAARLWFQQGVGQQAPMLHSPTPSPFIFNSVKQSFLFLSSVILERSSTGVERKGKGRFVWGWAGQHSHCHTYGEKLGGEEGKAM